MRNFAVFRGFCNLAGILVIAYAVYGVFSGELLVLAGKWVKGPTFVHGELLIWAALGWASLAIAAFLMPAWAAAWQKVPPGSRRSLQVPPAVWFLVLGILVLASLAHFR